MFDLEVEVCRRLTLVAVAEGELVPVPKEEEVEKPAALPVPLTAMPVPFPESEVVKDWAPSGMSFRPSSGDFPSPEFRVSRDRL